MSLTFRRRCARALVRAAVSVVPPERRAWAEAMLAEVEHLPDAAAPSFAAGCVWAAVRARTASGYFVLWATRWFLVANAVIWGALNLWLAGRLSVSDAGPAWFAYAAAAIYGLGAVAAARLGLRATVVLILPALSLATVIAGNPTILIPHSSHTAFQQALAVEHVGVLLVALLIALGVSEWVARRRIAI